MLTINREIREDLLAEKMNQDEGYTRFMTNRQLKRFLAGSVRPDYFNNLRRLAEENEKLKEEINHKNNKLSEWIVENKEIVVENNQLIEDAVENKKLFDTTFGELMKLKEQISITDDELDELKEENENLHDQLEDTDDDTLIDILGCQHCDRVETVAQWRDDMSDLREEIEELKKKVEYAGEHTWSERKQTLINEYMEATDGWMYYRDEFLPTYHPEEADPEKVKALEKVPPAEYI